MSSTKQIKCGGCGAVLKRTDKVCSYCGTENSEYVDPNQPSNNESRAVPDKADNKPLLPQIRANSMEFCLLFY